MTPGVNPLFETTFFETQLRPIYGKFYDVAPALLDALSAFTLNAGKPLEKHHSIIRYLCMMTSISFHDVAVLVAFGSGMGALKITRTALECAINAEYLRLFPSETERYLKWNYVERQKHLNYMRTRMPSVYAGLEPTMLAESDEMFKKVKPLFLDKKGKLRSSWCTRSVYERAKATDFEDAYYIIYGPSSWLSHGSFGGLAQFAESFVGDTWRPAIPPSLTACGPALQSIHFCGLRALKTLCLVNDKDSTPSILDLQKDFDSIWAEENAGEMLL